MATVNYNCGDKNFSILIPDHGRAHEWPNFSPGNDLVNFYPRSFPFLRTVPINGTIKVVVSTFYYVKDNQFVIFPKTEKNLTEFIPSGLNKARLLVIGLDTRTNVLIFLEGAEGFNSAYDTLDLPNIPTYVIPSALIRLQQGQTEVLERHITDIRVFLGQNAGGGSVSALDAILTDENGDVLSDEAGNVLYE